MKTFKQVEISKMTGLSKGFISRVLSDKDPLRPSWKTAKKLASATHTSPVLWLEGSSRDIKTALGLERSEKNSSYHNPDPTNRICIREVAS